MGNQVGLWQTDSSLLSLIEVKRQGLKVVHAPRGGSPNLTAQKGLFTIIAEPNIYPRPNAIDHRPLNEIVGDDIDSHDPNNPNIWGYQQIDTLISKLDGKKLFALYLLPIEQAPSLLSILDRYGYDAARVFPGFGGVATAVNNLGRLTNFSGLSSERP
jgi:hypothetical protein